MLVFVPGGGAVDQPAAWYLDPGEGLEVLGRADPLVRICVMHVPSASRCRGPCGRVGQVADQGCDRIRRQLEVGLEDPGVATALTVDRPGKARHPAAVLALRVGDVRLAGAIVDAEVVDQPQVRAFDRLEHPPVFERLRGWQRLIQEPVGVDPSAAGTLQ